MFNWFTGVLCPHFFRYSLGVSQEEMKQELHDYIPSLEHWAKEYLSPSSPKAVSLNMYVHLSVHMSHIYFCDKW